MISGDRISKSYLNELTYKIIGAAIEVHRHIGPGLLESVYHRCLKYEFELCNLVCHSDKRVNLNYKGILLGEELKCDFVFENCIALEIKSVESMHPVFEAQILTYMNLLEVPKGILINFNCKNIVKEGQKTFVNELYRSLPEI